MDIHVSVMTICLLKGTFNFSTYKKTFDCVIILRSIEEYSCSIPCKQLEFSNYYPT